MERRNPPYLRESKKRAIIALCHTNVGIIYDGHNKIGLLLLVVEPAPDNRDESSINSLSEASKNSLACFKAIY